MRISFYNTQNIVVPTLEDILILLNDSGHSARAYFSYSSYQNRSSNKISKYVDYAWLTYLTRSSLRLNQALYIIAVSFKLIFSINTKHIFLTQPPLAYLWFAFLCRIFRKDYAIHIMDQYPELLPQMGILNANSLSYKFLMQSRVKAFKGANFIIVLGQCMANLVHNVGVPIERIFTVKNIPSVSESKPQFEAKRTGSLRILYAGNMGMAHLFTTILNVSRNLSNRDIQFTFIGKGKRRVEIERFIEEYKPTNLEILGYLEKEEFERYLNQADIHFISLRKGFEGLMVPSKLYSSLAVGKPILYEGPANSEIALEIKNHNFGKHIDPGNEAALSDILLTLNDSPDDLERITKNAINYFQNHCNRSDIIEYYKTVIERNWVQ